MIAYGIALGAAFLGGWLMGCARGYAQALEDAKEPSGTVVGPPRSLE